MGQWPSRKHLGNSTALPEVLNLIIMDLTIPGGMGGKEAVKEILAINPKAKVLFSSGYSNDPEMANYKKYGFSGAMAKLYELKKLRKILDQVIGVA